MRASAGSPMPARATGSRLRNAARTNGLMVLSSSRAMLLVCAAPMQPRANRAANRATLVPMSFRQMYAVALLFALLNTGPALAQGRWSQMKPIPQGEEEVVGVAL